MANPAFNNSPAFKGSAPTMTAAQLDELYGRPAATEGDRPAAQPVLLPVEERMTYEDTIVKTLVAFAVLVVGAVVGWMIPALAIVGALVGFVLALVNIFKKMPSKALILTYALFEGLFVGGISAIFNSMWDGIVAQAVFGTLGVVGVTLALFLSGKVRATPKMTKIFLVAMVGYAAFSLVNFGLMMFGATDSMFGLRSYEIMGIPLGVIIGLFVVLLAAYSLVMDFENVKTGVERGVPRIFGWQAAFGIMVTVVWLYTEILRILAIFNSNN
ncbi:Bax inhibitor-1/YccA family protein [Salinibacterium sp. ZJ454]|uniref:Bax inhibitor-1/YccA family protein n=1 Tax=Salinibacterium sp. ZJ454 TaxID=2708339 RepID=UPI0014239C2D|nr:Bax inhibitor-1/YccA family protein [Salinibacterium sp. ZJ454]